MSTDTRQAATIAIAEEDLARLLPLDHAVGARLWAVTHDYARGRILVHLRDGDLPDVPAYAEAPLLTGATEQLARAARHPVGRLVAVLGTIGNPTTHDSAHRITDLVGGPSLACLRVDGAPIVDDTKAALLELAAHALILAGVTLAPEEVAEVLGLEEALHP